MRCLRNCEDFGTTRNFEGVLVLDQAIPDRQQSLLLALWRPFPGAHQATPGLQASLRRVRRRGAAGKRLAHEIPGRSVRSIPGKDAAVRQRFSVAWRHLQVEELNGDGHGIRWRGRPAAAGIFGARDCRAGPPRPSVTLCRRQDTQLVAVLLLPHPVQGPAGGEPEAGSRWRSMPRLRPAPHQRRWTTRKRPRSSSSIG